MNLKRRVASLFLALTLTVGLAVPALALDQSINYKEKESGFTATYAIKGATKKLDTPITVKELDEKITYCFEGDFNTTVDVSGMDTYRISLLEKQADGTYLATKSGAEVMDRVENHVTGDERSVVVDRFLQSEMGKRDYESVKSKYATVDAYKAYILSISDADWEAFAMDAGIDFFDTFVAGSYYKFTKPGVYLVNATGGRTPLAQPADKFYTALFITDSATAPTTPETPATVGAFTDVSATSPYADAVKWAVEKKITAGTTATTFAPAATCTNAQILTFLWRAKGQPEATIANPFTDVTESNYYYKAALWAHEKGLISGTVFGAAAPCTRSQTVTYLWTLAGKPTAAKAVTFTDVASDAAYAQAVAWAVEKGITTGTTATTFAPDTTCTRGQIVTFLYRDMK